MSNTDDTFVCGHGITVMGKRYIVVSCEYLPTPDGVRMNVECVSYNKLDPILYAFDTIKPKKSRKRKKKSKQ